ncbi:uncharacterized protein LOC116412841 [Galleria mellonella]|uniref:Uncharacterized protein LOC116412841 n=1 Tax=Galleria mellonella TaxID=7137 RepID=A0A6J3BSE3_GALME|nr:uncharacterized protein LOC116412841 [Galleria mellonella]
MNPNKKDNSGWILCPSKSFPGKFYYFNVTNGETAWSLNDTDKKNVRKDHNIENISDKSHNYPEPKSPPADYQIPTSSHVNYMNYQYPPQKPVNLTQPTPVFGQVIFPKYITESGPYMQNVIWTPIQLSTPVLVTSTPIKQTVNQKTQTFAEENHAHVPQTCGIPLFKRFKNFETPLLSFNDENKIKETNNLLSNLTNVSNTKIDNQITITQVVEPTTPVQTNNNNVTFRTLLALAHEKKKFQSDSESRNEINQVPMKTDTSISVLKTSPVRSGDKVEDDVEKNIVKLDALDKTDLRFLLVAKRRKSIDLGNLSMDTEEEIAKPIGKKRVSFDLTTRDDFSSEDVYYIDNEGNVNNTYEEELNTLKILKNLAPSHLQSDIWYIVVDAEILLEELAFIDSFVKLDSSCRLLVPRSVMEVMVAAGRGEDGGRRIVVARHIVRKLTASPPHIVVQELETSETAKNMSAIDRILNCCLKKSRQNYHVVLLTNDAKLYTKAESLHLHCYKLDEIKHGVQPQVTFEPEKLHVSVKNDNENLFLQSANDLNPFLLSKTIDFTVNVSRKPLFDKSQVQIVKHMADANTSPIKFDQIKNTDLEGISVQNKICEVDHERDSRICPDINADLKNMFRKSVTIKKYDYNSDRQIENQIDSFESHNQNSGKELPPNKLQNILINFPNTIEQRCQNVFDNSNQLGRENCTFEIQNQFDKENLSHTRKENGYKNMPVLDESQKIDPEASLDDILKSFNVINKDMEDTIKFKIDELFCSYSQIMEDALTILLQRCGDSNSLPLSPPWTLQEATVCIKEVCKDQNTVVVVDKLLIMLHSSSENGKLDSNMQANDFMQITGCSVILLESLQAVYPDCEALSEAEQLLINLIHNIQKPPSLDQKDLVPHSVPSHNLEEETVTPRKCFVKEPSKVLQYLQKHFPQWKTNVEVKETPKEESYTINNDTKIVRTFGRNLKNLTINNTKSLSLAQPGIDDAYTGTRTNETKVKCQINDVIIISNETKLPQQVDSTDNNNFTKLDESNYTRQLECANVDKEHDVSERDDVYFNTAVHGDTSNDVLNNGPKVIKNIRLIDAFEEKSKILCNLEALDYNTLPLSSIRNESFSIANNVNVIDDDDINKVTINNTDSVVLNNDNDYTANNKSAIGGSDTNRDDCTNDSGFESESMQAYSLLKIFLIELSGSLKSIYKFIDDNIAEFKYDENIQDEKKRHLHNKASLTHCHLANIIDKLKGIIQRESKESSELKELLIKAGIQASTDKRMTRYRQVVTKCLEQAQMLENALKMMLALTDDDDASISTVSLQTIKYYNLFEN